MPTNTPTVLLYTTVGQTHLGGAPVLPFCVGAAGKLIAWYMGVIGAGRELGW